VGTLSSQVTFKPLSCSLQTSIRFLHSPKPTYLSASLTLCFPYLNGDIWGFHVPLIERKYRLGSIYTPMVFCLRIRSIQSDIPPYTFWFKPISAFGLFRLYDAYDRLLVLSIPYTLAPIPIWHYQYRFLLTDSSSP